MKQLELDPKTLLEASVKDMPDGTYFSSDGNPNFIYRKITDGRFLIILIDNPLQKNGEFGMNRFKLGIYRMLPDDYLPNELREHKVPKNIRPSKFMKFCRNL